MKLGGKNKQKSQICDIYNWNDSALLGGGVNSEKFEKNDVFLTYEGVIGSS